LMMASRGCSISGSGTCSADVRAVNKRLQAPYRGRTRLEPPSAGNLRDQDRFLALAAAGKHPTGNPPAMFSQTCGASVTADVDSAGGHLFSVFFAAEYI
jgi:hypothetical protein